MIVTWLIHSFLSLQLIGGLADERGRWEESVARLEKEIDLIVGDVLISSGAVAYLGPFTVSVIIGCFLVELASLMLHITGYLKSMA